LSWCSAADSPISKRSVVSATGLGNTFSETSTIKPSVPRLPANTRETS
jgi:hypothetical protein